MDGYLNYFFTFLSVHQSQYNSNGMSKVSVGQSLLPQVKKIFCAYHPQQFLTNFCTESDCLMPLCPNCVVEHTEQHFLENNKPTYLNINDALNQVKQKCYHHIILFEQLSKQNDRIYQYTTTLKDNIHNQLEQDKEAIFRNIDKLFTSFQEKIFKETLERYNEASAYDRKQSETISEYIAEQIDLLYDRISALKGDNCLAGLITYYASDAALFNEGITQISTYVRKNHSMGKITLSVNQEKIQELFQQFCEGVITVESLTQESSGGSNSGSNGNIQINSNVNMRRPLLQTRLNSHRKVVQEKENVGVNEQSYKNLIKKTEQTYRAAAMEGQFKKEEEQRRIESRAYEPYRRTQPRFQYHVKRV